MDSPEPKKPLMKRIQERLAASRFFTFSLLIHVVIVIVGGSVVLIKQQMEQPDFSASEGGLVSNEVSVQPPADQPVDLTQTQFTPQAPQINAPQLQAISTTNVSTPTFAVAAITPQVKAMPTDAMSKALSNVTNTMAQGLKAGVPGGMAGRMGGTARGKMMADNGGKKKSEEAVMRGLNWLKKTQNADGSWSTEHRPAMTGLALLCFLGHGELPTSPEFGDCVRKGVDWMVQQGTQYQGRLSMTKDGWGGGNHGVYEHGIAAYALGEYYSLTKDERVAELFKQAIGYIVQGQGPDGGWMYSFNKSQSDTSVSGWQIQALKAAHLTGLSIAGVDEALDKAMLNLKRVQGDAGGFGYRTPEDRYSLTGVGVLCTYFWKQKKDSSVQEGIEFIIKKSKGDFPVQYKGEKADLYAWYYHTQACLMYGGSAWSTWNRLFQDEIVDAQSPDGSWPVTGGKGGHRENEPTIMGQTYRTTLCILMLEVFYRYMPINKGGGELGSL